MKKIFSEPEIKTVSLPGVEAVMSSNLVNRGANGSISYTLTDDVRDEAAKQSYWAGK